MAPSVSPFICAAVSYVPNSNVYLHPSCAGLSHIPYSWHPDFSHAPQTSSHRNQIHACKNSNSISKSCTNKSLIFTFHCSTCLLLLSYFFTLTNSLNCHYIAIKLAFLNPLIIFPNTSLASHISNSQTSLSDKSNFLRCSFDFNSFHLLFCCKGITYFFVLSFHRHSSYCRHIWTYFDCLLTETRVLRQNASVLMQGSF